MEEDDKNPFSQDNVSGSQPDFSVKKFSSDPARNTSQSSGVSGEQTPKDPEYAGYTGQAPKNPEGTYTEQAQFPQFENTQTYNYARSTGSANARMGADSQNFKQATPLTSKDQGKQSSFNDVQQRIEAAKSNGWGAQLANFISVHKFRILTLIAIVLLFAGGSYISNRNNQNDVPALGLVNISENINTNDETDIGVNDANSETFSTNILDIKLDEGGEVLFEEARSYLLAQNDIGEITEDGTTITKIANLGDGITHLARYAIDDYLEKTGKNLSAEQRIYAEDYVQNKIGSELLEVGQRLSFSKELLANAIERAEGLEAWQLENLEQYTQ